MRLSTISLALFLSSLTALATPNVSLAAESNNALLKRDTTLTKMRPLMARCPGQSPANIIARSPRPQYDGEASCASDERRCGGACVPEDYNCCPSDVSGGCPREEKCQEDHGRWGCCPEGDDCSWDEDDDDDDGVVDRIEDFGDDIKDGWDDFWDGGDDAAGMLKPGVGVALVAAIVAVVLPY
ncbi:uncharacterized protein BJX67DRAFT_383964 [Aspergillus lucknowensis]|uniref:GPI anchored protein n=1 Tax=Aspergillus lucknowensis TaxID=176173 RepID=A0ABR4LIC9_9EURO